MHKESLLCFGFDGWSDGWAAQQVLSGVLALVVLVLQLEFGVLVRK